MNKGECSWLHQTNPQRFVPGVAQASSCLHGTPLPGVGCRLHDGTVITHYKRRGTIHYSFLVLIAAITGFIVSRRKTPNSISSP
jgi:hypothetical protein